MLSYYYIKSTSFVLNNVIFEYYVNYVSYTYSIFIWYIYINSSSSIYTFLYMCIYMFVYIHMFIRIYIHIMLYDIISLLCCGVLYYIISYHMETLSSRNNPQWSSSGGPCWSTSIFSKTCCTAAWNKSAKPSQAELLFGELRNDKKTMEKLGQPWKTTQKRWKTKRKTMENSAEGYTENSHRIPSGKAKCFWIQLSDMDVWPGVCWMHVPSLSIFVAKRFEVTTLFDSFRCKIGEKCW